MSNPRCTKCANMAQFCDCTNKPTWTLRVDVSAEEDSTIYNVVLDGPDGAVIIASYFALTDAVRQRQEIAVGIVRGLRDPD